ncbi:MAG TPA: band 7 protein, partial [Thiothrix sp.]|nr:band 7 protein [Thiothrix sp.]
MFLENVTALTYDGDKAGYIIMGFDYWLLILFIVLVIAGVITFYMVFYERPTKETSYVRTGAGGEFVLMDRGGFVLPVIHEAIPVRMNTQKIEIHRNEEFALITKDRLRVDATAEFHLRVKADEKSISAAARTLGEKTLTPDLLKEQVEGLCVGALRSVAAEMDMDELHEKRREFEHNVERNISNVLLEMGLELVSVSMTALDQTALRFFDDSNALNVDGITYIQQKIAESQKRQNEVEQDKEVHIRRKEVEAREKKLQIEKEEAFFEQNQQREIAESEFKTELAIQKAKTAKEVEMMELDRKEKITKALAQRSVAKAWVETDKYKAQAASASEKIETSRKQAV